MTLIWLGALFMICGVMYMAWQAIARRPLSRGPTMSPASRQSLEPLRQGVRFLGVSANWPGLALMVIGAILLLVGGAS